MIRVAQVLLILASGALWVASRLPWVTVGSEDGLGPPRTITLDGAQWAPALAPIAALLVASALAGLAARGLLLRAMAILLAVVSFGLGYLGLSFIVMPDVGPRGATLASVQIATLVSSQRHLLGALITLAAAAVVLTAAVLLIRAAATATPTARYTTSAGAADPVTERGLWDALDQGHDPTLDEPDLPGR